MNGKTEQQACKSHNSHKLRKLWNLQKSSDESAQSGFTLVEILMVVVIIAVLSAIVIPRVSSSSATARTNADIATAHQIKTALDRYQAENGLYPNSDQLTANDGAITSTVLIPNYIGKLNANTIQQQAGDNKGFGVEEIGANGTIPATATVTKVIMIYINDGGTAAEVRVYDDKLAKILWSSEG
jgi:general secretion pathway protein G